MQRSLSPSLQRASRARNQQKIHASKKLASKRSNPRVQVTEYARSRATSDSHNGSQGSVRYQAMTSEKVPRRSNKNASRIRKKAPPSPPPTVSKSLSGRTEAARELGLGNGSHPSEFLSAAVRLIGIKDGFLKESFLRHLLSVSGVELKLKAPQNVYAGAVFAHFQDQGREVLSPKPGDLVFFATPRREGQAAEDQFTTAAVLEAIEANGTYRCIGWVLGEVQRFKMDPRRPNLRRNERTGERINDVIRERSMDEGHGEPALAGKLLVGFLRL